MKSGNQRVIVVLGMHRSGTSAITRSLSALGVELGNNLIPAGLDNPRGFWEDRECLAINEELLALLGSSLYQFGLAFRISGDDTRLDLLRTRARQYVTARVAQYEGLWSFKDPRTCRLLEFWIPVFQDCACEPLFVLVLRNPLSVAQSLEKRDGIPVEKGGLLWLQHTLATLEDTRSYPRIVVEYDLLIDDPVFQLNRLARFLGLPWSDDQAGAVGDFARDFLDEELRHTRYASEEIAGSDRVPADAKIAFGILSRIARDELPIDAPVVGAAIKAMLDRSRDYLSAYSYPIELESRFLQLRGELADSDANVVRLTSLLQGRESEVVTLRARSADDDVLCNALRAELVKLEDALTDARSGADSLLRLATERSARISTLELDLAEHANRVLGLEAALSRERSGAAVREKIAMEREMRVAVLEQDLADRGTRIRGLEMAVSRHRASVVADGRRTHELGLRVSDLEKQLVRRDKQVTEFEDALATRDRLVTDLQNRIEEFEKESHERGVQIAGLLRSNDEFSRELRDLMDSKSWALTKPLRDARRNLVSRPNRLVRKVGSDSARAIWHQLPVSEHRKQRFKSALFGALPNVFRWTKAYRSWIEFNAPVLRVEGSPAATAGASGLRRMPGPRDHGYPVNFEYVPLLHAAPVKHPQARLICFYLPQFHPIPENDAWWGEGFTEWANVRPAQSMFPDHYQPRVPDELGYYDLRDPAVQRRQVELARLYGVEGFCFYFYWFGGKRLLEKPVENYLSDSTLDLPFCLCWANENWSRKWDGLDSDILIAQQHSDADDLAFIECVAAYMRDSRYLRVGGKPLLLVYRPSLLPSAIATAQRWRQWCRANGIGEIHLAYTQSFENVDPAQYGFDAAIEFPPNNSAPPDLTDQRRPADVGFMGKIYDWSIFVDRSREYRTPDYRLYRGVCPGWDNTARRRHTATAFVNNSPALYRIWLENAVRDTRQRIANPDERLIFVNAWNEWAEGAYLEPDARFGYAWLQSTRDAITSQSPSDHAPARKLIVVTHDALPHGAQFLALNMTRELTATLGCEVEVVCLGGGPLKPQFGALAAFHDLTGIDPHGIHARNLAHDLVQRGFVHAIVNTTVSGLFLATLDGAGIKCVALIHEMRDIIRAYRLQAHARSIGLHAASIVVAASEVGAMFAECAEIDAERITVRPQGLYKRNPYARGDKGLARQRLRAELGISPDTKVVLGVGYADHRKGVDYFVEMAVRMVATRPSIHFVWVGHWDGEMQRKYEARQARQPESMANLHFIGRREDTSTYYAGADIFALTSREDPFPSVVLESMEVGLPVVAFAGSGGCSTLIDDGVGVNVPMGDVDAFGAAIHAMLADEHRREQIARRGTQLIEERFSFRAYLFELLAMLKVKVRRVSVIVPNFNYAHYMRERLSSIYAQTYPICEILFLDDASIDGSVEVADEILANGGIDYRIVRNAENSGSVTAQWRRGCEMARGEIVWIAEADDLSNPAFLETVIGAFEDPEVVLGYCESMQIDAGGRVLDTSYRQYVADLGGERWREHFVNDGVDEIRRFLAVKNTIPNVSGALIRREDLARVLANDFDFINSFRTAADWMTYLRLLPGAKLAYFPQSLNLHRRHGGGVTIRAFGESHLREIHAVQEWVAHEFACEPATVAAADAYRAFLAKQFEIEPSVLAQR